MSLRTCAIAQPHSSVSVMGWPPEAAPANERGPRSHLKVDKSFWKNGTRAISSIRRILVARAASRRRGERAHENHGSRAGRREYNLRSESRNFLYLNRP